MAKIEVDEAKPPRSEEPRPLEDLAEFDGKAEFAKSNAMLRDFGIAVSLAIPVLAMGSVLAGDPFWRRAVLVVLWLVGHLIAEIFRNKGQIERAGASMAIAGWGVVFGIQWWSGGMLSPIAGGQALVIMLGGLIGGGRKGGRRLGVTLWAMSMANCAAMWWADAHGLIPEPTLAQGDMGMFSQHFAIVTLAAIMMWVALGRLDSVAEAARGQRGRALAAVDNFKTLFVRSDAPMALSRAASLSDPGALAGMAANPAFERLFGADGSESAALAGDQRPLWADQSELSSALRELSAGREVDRRKIRMRSLDGAELVCMASAKRVEWDGVAAVLWTFQDLTANERLSESLERLNSELGERVAAKAEELAAARQELERRERLALLGDMVAGVAHEINTPLGNALLSASALAEPARRLREMAAGGSLSRSELSGMASKVAEASGIAMENLGRAAEIIKNFKQLSADQAGQARRCFDMPSVVSGALRAMGPAFRGAGVQWEIESTPEAREAVMDGFPGAVSQIATILGSNAVLHGFSDGSMAEGRRFKASISLDERGWLRAVFSDNGLGLRPEVASRIFEPFFTTKPGAGGTGLGLAIAWNLARDALGGELRLDPRSDHSLGCSFELLAPQCAPIAQSPPASGQAPQAS